MPNCRAPCSRDHPRACGEHHIVSSQKLVSAGSSPRMRGTRQAWQNMVYRYGIIPAHAGNTAPRYRRDHPRWDHPRACGEHQTGQPCTNVYLGSSPRMRGTLLGYVQEVAEHGIIPAHAGNTYRAAHPGVAKWDHPRACGEHGRVDIVHPHVAGSSPRMRGTPILLRLNSQRARIIPAHAGNTVVDFRCRLEPWDHPRACGEHTKGWTGTLVTWGSSPRMRGTRRSKCSVYRFEGIIPAHAGNTPCNKIGSD